MCEMCHGIHSAANTEPEFQHRISDYHIFGFYGHRYEEKIHWYIGKNECESEKQNIWGSKRFLIFYFVCGIGAAVVQEAVWALTWQQYKIEYKKTFRTPYVFEHATEHPEGEHVEEYMNRR